MAGVSSVDWIELDRIHLWHPYTQHATAPAPVPITRAAGAYLYDIGGRPILDLISSWWVTLHGHGHPAIASAIAQQARALEQVIFAGFTHEPAARLAHELVRRLPPGLERVFYSDDGSTAVEVAVKMAHQYWANRGERRPIIAALEHAYHGDTVGAMSVSARGVFTTPFEPLLFEVVRLPDPSHGDLLESLRRLLTERGEQVAAVLVEPLLLGAGGMRVWDRETLAQVRSLTTDRGVLLIADEVLTGFGRTGPVFACELAGISPDLICLSKGLTGGFLPLGVTAVRESIYQAFLSEDRRQTFFHGHSYTANPLACAAARASLDLLDDNCQARRHEIERAHRAGIALLGHHSRVRQPRILGTMAAFDLEGEGYLDPIGPTLATRALEAGLLIRPLGNTVYLLPPYCVTPDELAGAYRFLERFVATLR